MENRIIDCSNREKGPRIHIWITVKICHKEEKLRALVDTGSPATLINQKYIPSDAIPDEECMLYGVNGSEHCFKYRVNIEIESRDACYTFSNVLVTAFGKSDEQAIIGCNLISLFGRND